MATRFEPSGPLSGSLRPPADKSISHRAALIAAMGEGETTIEGYLDAADTRSTLTAVGRLGVEVTGVGAAIAPTISVAGIGLQGAVSAAIDVGNAGTLLRLLPGWLAGQPGGTWELDGDDSIRRRPIDRVAEPLSAMGAQLRCRENRFTPLTIEGEPLTGISYEMPVASAQVKSCLLFAGLLAEGETRVLEPLPSRDHTERMLAAAGAAVEKGDGFVAVTRAERLAPGRIVVPGDISSAAFFIVAALLIRGQRGAVWTASASTRPGPACSRSSSGWAPGSRGSKSQRRAASRSARCSSAPRRCRAPRSAAPRSRWRSTSCPWSRSPPASPRARRRSATPPSCGARSRTGSRRSRRR